ncbi:MAG: hypothetical protein ACAI34_07120 [Verrucomicrobium sp.]|nr:hypothetical protein [Verrucomicrobium sp.]
MNFSKVDQHKHLGYEFDWLATDNSGAIGFFSTGGAGWLPAAIAESVEDNLDLLSKTLRLPKTTDAIVRCRVKHLISDWIAVSERGIYTFDWNWSARRYERVADPKAALRPSQNLAEFEGLLRISVPLNCAFDDDVTFPASVD